MFTYLTDSFGFLAVCVCVLCVMCMGELDISLSACVVISQQNSAGSKGHLPFLHNILKVMQAICTLLTVRVKLLRISSRMMKVHIKYNVL